MKRGSPSSPSPGATLSPFVLFLGTRCLIHVVCPLFDSHAQTCLLLPLPASLFTSDLDWLCLSFDFRLPDLVIGPREFMGVTNFSTFLLDSSTGMLFLGARDAILAVDTNRLQQPPKKVGRTVLEDEVQKCGNMTLI